MLDLSTINREQVRRDIQKLLDDGDYPEFFQAGTMYDRETDCYCVAGWLSRERFNRDPACGVDEIIYAMNKVTEVYSTVMGESARVLEFFDETIRDNQARTVMVEWPRKQARADVVLRRILEAIS
jgi:hypothetical protein